jgi:UDP-galactopyranose mutase
LEIICFSHLRWDFVYQRPQHLLSRFAQRGTVHFWEEPIYEAIAAPDLRKRKSASGVHLLTPILPQGASEEESIAFQRSLLDTYVAESEIQDFAAWYYTPMALRFSGHLAPTTVVYDCMDELSAFQGAPPALIQEEQRLFACADVVFAGGASLFESKRKQHRNIHLLPSSIDHQHFAAARTAMMDPEDQAKIPHPRVGFYGVLDERLDRDLLQQIAALRPDYHFVLLGPLAKISEHDLPHSSNLHYLGMKSYGELPAYLGNWDVAMLPFALNASTKYISPTKTPEYLAGGKPVVSTAIQDVVSPYAEKNLVSIGRTASQFAEAIDRALDPPDGTWRKRVDAHLAENSWDKTFEKMWSAIRETMRPETNAPQQSTTPTGVQLNV